MTVRPASPPPDCPAPQPKRGKVKEGTKEVVCTSGSFVMSIKGDGIQLPTEAEILQRTKEREDSLRKEIEEQALRQCGRNNSRSGSTGLRLRINVSGVSRFGDDPAARVASRVFERGRTCDRPSGPPSVFGAGPLMSVIAQHPLSFGIFDDVTDAWKQMLKSDNGLIRFREIDGKEEDEKEVFDPDAILKMVIYPIVQSDIACIDYLKSDEAAKTQFIKWMAIILESAFGIITEEKDASILNGCLTLDEITGLNEIFGRLENQIYFRTILNVCMELGFQTLAVRIFCIIAARVVLRTELVDSWARSVGIPVSPKWKDAFFFWSDQSLLTEDLNSDLENIRPQKDVDYKDNKSVVADLWKNLIDSLPDVENGSKQVFALFLETTKVVAAMEELLPYLSDILKDNLSQENIKYINKLLIFLTLSGKTDKASELFKTMRDKAGTDENMIAAMEFTVSWAKSLAKEWLAQTS